MLYQLHVTGNCGHDEYILFYTVFCNDVMVFVLIQVKQCSRAKPKHYIILKKFCMHALVQVGTTSSTAVDPLLELGKITKVTNSFKLSIKKLR